MQRRHCQSRHSSMAYAVYFSCDISSKRWKWLHSWFICQNGLAVAAYCMLAHHQSWLETFSETERVISLYHTYCISYPETCGFSITFFTGTWQRQNQAAAQIVPSWQQQDVCFHESFLCFHVSSMFIRQTRYNMTCFKWSWVRADYGETHTCVCLCWG